MRFVAQVTFALTWTVDTEDVEHYFNEPWVADASDLTIAERMVEFDIDHQDFMELAANAMDVEPVALRVERVEDHGDN